jgi:hypothetical protein
LGSVAQVAGHADLVEFLGLCWCHLGGSAT